MKAIDRRAAHWKMKVTDNRHTQFNWRNLWVNDLNNKVMAVSF